METQRNCLLHDLISWVFLRSLEFGIVVLGFLHAFVYVHHKNHLDSAKLGTLVIVCPEKFGSCLSSLLPTPTNTRPFVLGSPFQVFRTTHSVFPCPSPDFLFYPVIVLSLKNLAMSTVGGLIIKMVVPLMWMVKQLNDGAQFPDPSWTHLRHVWSVISTEAELVFFGSRTHFKTPGSRTHSKKPLF